MRRFVLLITFFGLLACDPTAGGRSGDNDKKTAALVPEASIIIYGDSRSGHVTHRLIANAIASLSPDFIFHTGDLVHLPESPEDWQVFDSITAGLRNSAAFYPARGNHDAGEAWYEFFELPGNEMWYEVTVRGMRFLVLDSTSPIEPGSEQYEWLKAALSSQSEESGLLMVVLHHPVYSSSLHGGREDLSKGLVPLFKRYGVDAVFSGHCHNYEHVLKGGIHYVTTGGGGALLYRFAKKHPGSLAFYSAYHFLGLKREGDRVHVTAYTPELQVLDDFYISDR